MKKILGISLKVVLLSQALGLMLANASAQQRNTSWNENLRWNTESRPVERESVSEPPVLTDETGGGWLADRLTIGLGVRVARFTDNHRPADREGGKTFVGYVNELDLENETLLVPVVTYWTARYLRLSATWETLKGRTYNYDPYNPDGPHAHSDGRLKLDGPVFMVEGLWPMMDDTLFPHAGAGLFVGMGEFREDDFWHYGYGSQESYEAYGKPKKTRLNYKREIHSDDAIGWLVSAGVAWRPFKHFQADLEVRQMWVEPDCEYGYMYKSGWDPHRKGEFTFDNLTWTLSAAYVF